MLSHPEMVLHNLQSHLGSLQLQVAGFCYAEFSAAALKVMKSFLLDQTTKFSWWCHWHWLSSKHCLSGFISGFLQKGISAVRNLKPEVVPDKLFVSLWWTMFWSFCLVYFSCKNNMLVNTDENRLCLLQTSWWMVQNPKMTWSPLLKNLHSDIQ